MAQNSMDCWSPIAVTLTAVITVRQLYWSVTLFVVLFILFVCKKFINDLLNDLFVVIST